MNSRFMRILTGGDSLMPGVANSLAVGGEDVKDLVSGLGPHEWPGVLVPGTGPLAQVGFQFGAAAVRGAAREDHRAWLADGRLQAGVPRQLALGGLPGAGWPARWVTLGGNKVIETFFEIF
jgi:hypothetical protein